MVATLATTPLLAKPEGPDVFCATYPEAPACQGQVVSCGLCHAGPPDLNPFGIAVAVAVSDASYDGSLSMYEARLPDALASIEADDSDLDGTSNFDELLLGTAPGDIDSHWAAPAPSVGLENPFLNVDGYDPRFALARVSALYCGQSATYEEVQAQADAPDPRAVVHTKLDACLQSTYWRDEALHRLADDRIRPLKAVGGEGEIMLADYRWDYRLFSHVLTDGRDARDLLLADYHVDEAGQVVTGTIDMLPGSILATNPIRVGTGQPLPAARRAGMITTQWFLVTNTMFTALPRTTAANAYRSYLGQNIASGEGIHPVAGEPLDVDGMGVQVRTCEACHATLDPLSYAFADYHGIEINPIANIFGLNLLGSYAPNRTDIEAQTVVLGQPVSSVVEWAQVASESDEFKRNLVDMFWHQALGRGPSPDEQADYLALWQGLPAEGYSADAMLHRFIDTPAFGAP